MSKRLTTGVFVDCPCGATGVPMAWGCTDGEIRLYRHMRGESAAGKAGRGDKCGGPRDLFSYLLREGELMMAGPRLRVMTRAEAVVNDAFAVEFEKLFADSGQGQSV